MEIEHNGYVAVRDAMARDLYLLKESKDRGSAVFRTYMWEKPAISLGRLQRSDEILNPEEIRRKKIEVTQRPTGGRHILHGDDISFSLIIPPQQIDEWGNTVSARISKISSYIAKAFTFLNISLDSESKEISRQRLIAGKNSPCFLSTAPAELSFNGKKLVGLAQLVQAEGVLIQGTIPLNNIHTLLPRYERIPLPEQDRLIRRLREETINLTDICGSAPSYSDICEAFSKAFHV